LFGLGFGLLAAEVVDQGFGVDLFLDVDGWGLDDEVGPVLFVFAAPYELGVEVAVATFVGYSDGGLVFIAHHGLEFGRGDVFARGFVVNQGFHAF
jgi:hypothetical protein